MTNAYDEINCEFDLTKVVLDDLCRTAKEQKIVFTDDAEKNAKEWLTLFEDNNYEAPSIAYRQTAFEICINEDFKNDFESLETAGVTADILQRQGTSALDILQMQANHMLQFAYSRIVREQIEKYSDIICERLEELAEDEQVSSSEIGFKADGYSIEGDEVEFSLIKVDL